MKNAYDVLTQKETDIARLRREVDSLRIVASLLDDECSDNPKEDAISPSEERTVEPQLNLDALENDSLFSSIGLSSSRLWKVFRRAS